MPINLSEGYFFQLLLKFLFDSFAFEVVGFFISTQQIELLFQIWLTWNKEEKISLRLPVLPIYD